MSSRAQPQPTESSPEFWRDSRREGALLIAGSEHEEEVAEIKKRKGRRRSSSSSRAERRQSRALPRKRLGPCDPAVLRGPRDCPPLLGHSSVLSWSSWLLRTTLCAQITWQRSQWRTRTPALYPLPCQTSIPFKTPASLKLKSVIQSIPTVHQILMTNLREKKMTFQTAPKIPFQVSAETSPVRTGRAAALALPAPPGPPPSATCSTIRTC